VSDIETKDKDIDEINKKPKKEKKAKKEKKHREPRTKKQKIRLAIIIVAIVVVVAIAGILAWNHFMNSRLMDKDSDGTDARTVQLTAENINILIQGEGFFAEEYKDSKRVNVLLLGTTPQELADTIMLASFNPTTKKLDIVSVPRDTYFPREGMHGGWNKINTVMHKGPFEMAKAVHELLLGIPINYYAVIDYNGIINIVDAVGGVPMNVKQDMHYKAADLTIDINKGQQVLDGEHAVQFLRFRSGYANADLGRQAAQQQFIKNGVDAALQSNILKIARVVIDNVDSDITVRAMLYVATQAKDMGKGAVKTFTLGGRGAMLEGASILYPPEPEAIEELLRTIYDDKDTSDDAAIKESEYSKFYSEDEQNEAP
jgi:LCP family protein required for cell wall assembly